jgi:hypothetical protein
MHEKIRAVSLGVVTAIMAIGAGHSIGEAENLAQEVTACAPESDGSIDSACPSDLDALSNEADERRKSAWELLAGTIVVGAVTIIITPPPTRSSSAKK